MGRAHFRDSVVGKSTTTSGLLVLSGATVTVYQTGTTTPITQTIYAAATGSTSLSNPLTADANGLVEFWLDTDQRVDLSIAKTGYTTQTVTVDVVDTTDEAVYSVVDYGALGDGSTDDTAAIQAAVDALPAAGGVVYLPPGRYKVTSTITLGNGTSSASSTRRRITFRGAGAGEVDSEIASSRAATSLDWFGAAAGTVVKLQGPISACVLEDFGIDCQPTGASNAAGTALLLEHVMDSEFNRLTMQRFSGVAIDLTAYSTHASAANGADDNIFRLVKAEWPTGSSATCIRIGASDYGSSPHLDPARNLFLGCSFRCVNAGGNAGTAIHLRFTDACTFIGCQTAGTHYIEVTVPSGSGGDAFPSSNTFLHCYLVGGAPLVTGTWAGTQPIELLNVHTGDGWTIPTDSIFRGYTNKGTFFDNKVGYQTMQAASGLSPEWRFSRAGTDSVGLISDAAGQLKVWDYANSLYLLNLVNGVSTLKAKSGVNPEYKLNRNGTDAFGLYSGATGFLQGWDYSAGAEAFRWSGNHLMIGGSATRATTQPTKALSLFDGTAPAGTLANGVTLYSASGECRVMDAAGNSTLLSPHDDDNYWVFDSVHSPTGKKLRIDVEKLLRFLNDHFGLSFVHDSEEGA